ncbi:MAG: protein TolQ, partial [Lysobacteraceae bacterium]
MFALIQSPLIHLSAAMQAASAAALPDAAQTIATSASVTHDNGLHLLALVTQASLPVQLVLVLLLIASITSWVIIFRKQNVLGGAEKSAEAFEERFWSGADLTHLYRDATERNRVVSGLEAIFEAGFREFSRLR